MSRPTHSYRRMACSQGVPGRRRCCSGTPTQVFYSSPGQINFLIPPAVANRFSVQLQIHVAAEPPCCSRCRWSAPHRRFLPSHRMAWVRPPWSTRMAASDRQRERVRSSLSMARASASSAAADSDGLSWCFCVAGDRNPGGHTSNGGLRRRSARIHIGTSADQHPRSRGTPSGDVPLSLSVGGTKTQAGVTLAIQ